MKQPHLLSRMRKAMEWQSLCLPVPSRSSLLPVLMWHGWGPLHYCTWVTWSVSSLKPEVSLAKVEFACFPLYYYSITLTTKAALCSQHSTEMLDRKIALLVLPTHHSEKAMAPHSSPLAWKMPWTEEPGRLQSVGSLRVGHNWATSLSFFTFMHWRRKWKPTPVFLPGES